MNNGVRPTNGIQNPHGNNGSGGRQKSQTRTRPAVNNVTARLPASNGGRTPLLSRTDGRTAAVVQNKPQTSDAKAARVPPPNSSRQTDAGRRRPGGEPLTGTKPGFKPAVDPCARKRWPRHGGTVGSNVVKPNRTGRRKTAAANVLGGYRSNSGTNDRRESTGSNTAGALRHWIWSVGRDDPSP